MGSLSPGRAKSAFAVLSVCLALLLFPREAPADTWSKRFPAIKEQAGETDEGMGTVLQRMERWQAYRDRGQRNPQDNEFQERYEHWQELPPAEKNKLRNRMNQYRQMSPREREQYQQRFHQWQNMTPQDRNRIQRNLERWNELSPEEKNAIRHRFRD